MKKTILSIILLLSGMIPLHAEHDYIPYVREGNVWVIRQWDCYRQYSIGESELIDGVEYHKMYETFYDMTKNQVNSPTEYDYIWEVDKKVYIGLDKKRLLYDFGAQKGDTIYITHWFDRDDSYITIDSVYEQGISGERRIVQEVRYHSDAIIIPSKWIEGIGAEEDVFESEYCQRWGAAGWIFVFMYYNNTISGELYPETAELIDFSGINGVEAEGGTFALHRTDETLMATFPEQGQEAELAVYDITGKRILLQTVGAGATTATLHMAGQPQGVYVVTLITPTATRTTKVVW